MLDEHTPSAPFAADWRSPPGETVADLLAERGETSADLARALGCAESRVAALLRGERPIDRATAARLARALGPSARFWLAREARYRRALHHADGTSGEADPR